MLRRTSFLSYFSALTLLASFATAQAPPGYYSSVNTSNGSTLRSTLHQVIDDHQRFPYTSGGTDTWNILELADEDPNNSSRIIDIYKNESYPKAGGGNSNYNREHTWPSSYGFPNDGGSNYPYTDCHQLFLCDDGYNSARANHPFRDCNAGCTERTTEFNDGRGGGSGFYPGNSNWDSGTGTSGTWQVWSDRRGDIARAMFYADVRYEGGTHNVTGHLEPNLILTDNQTLIANSNTGSNISVAYMGMLTDLLQWHIDDPVDAGELARNDVVFSFQGNRNPFVDHPEWVDCIFNGMCGPPDMTPPAPPTGLGATAGAGLVSLDWNDSPESDFAGYRVYRSGSSGGPYGEISSGLVGTSSYNDNSDVNGTTDFYVVTAEDLSSNESGNSAQVFATPMGGMGGPGDGDPWINEFHYDNASSDTGEFVEIAGPEGLDLSGYDLVGYNGSNGNPYNTINLSGVFTDQGDCIGVLSFGFTGLQNGAPDGLALVDPMGAVLEFISYEGSFAANSGDASGMMSTNIGVSETGTTPIGHSLQLGGTGAQSSDFTWQSPQTDSPGFPNAGQTFSGGCVVPPTPPAAPTGLFAVSNDSSVSLTWTANVEPDLAGYQVYRSLVSGSGFSQINAFTVGTNSYFDASAVNGTTYFYVVTAENSGGLESSFSAEAQGDPQDMTPPPTPTNVGALAGDMSVQLDWNSSSAPDLAGYNVYRSANPAGPFALQNVGLIIVTSFADSGLTNGVEYYYRVTAVDSNSNESAPSFDVYATPKPTPTPWINEIHYLNGGRFTTQRIEIAGKAGLDLTGWEIALYSSSGGLLSTTAVSGGALVDAGNGSGVRVVPLIGMDISNGGIALVDSFGNLKQFLSYGGIVRGIRGPAAGLESVDIGLIETKHTSGRASLQLVGSGNAYSHFTWQANLIRTWGAPNFGQLFQ